MKEVVEKWFDKVNGIEIVPTNITALNFGLFESDENYILYLTGSEIYDESDDDWATEIDYEPKNKYVVLPDSKNRDWKEVQYEIENIITGFINTESFQNSIFSKIKNITVGFDNGDLKKIK